MMQRYNSDLATPQSSIRMTARQSRKRPTLLKPRSNVRPINRLSMSYERVSNLRSCLNRKGNLTPTARAARSITRRERRIRFRSRGSVLEITPLADKPRGKCRMPVSPTDDNDETNNENNNPDAEEIHTSGPSLSEIVFSKPRTRIQDLRKYVQPITPSKLQDALQLLTEPSICTVTESMSSFELNASTNVNNLWGAEGSESYERGQSCRLNAERQRSELWCSLFAPHDKNELLNQSAYMHSWFKDWHKRLATRKADDPPLPKRKRRSVMYDDEDDDYQSSNSDLPNPLIISGPNGCGKTSAVHCVACEYEMRVLEFSPSERRNGASLEKKLAGAIDSHYVHANSPARGTTDIRQMFSPISHKSASRTNEIAPAPQYKFSVVLIDDCDVIYASDEGFWSTLKNMFDDAKIPIVLTCRNLDYVNRKLGSAYYQQSEKVQFVTPSITRLFRKLRPWVAGFACKLLTARWLRRLIETRKGDVRGVLNELHLQVDSGRLDEIIANSVTLLSLKSHSNCSRVLAELDAAYGQDASAITWRAKETADFDYRPDTQPAYQIAHSLEPIVMSKYEPLMTALSPIVSLVQFAPLFSISSDKYCRSPIQALHDAWSRSVATPYSWRDVGTDYMACLCAINEKFTRESRERFNNGGGMSDTLTTSSRRARAAERDRVMHPFDDTDNATCEMIDKKCALRVSISTYAFSNIHCPAP